MGKYKKKFHVGYVDADGSPSNPTPLQQDAWELLNEDGVVSLLVEGGTRGGKTGFGVDAMLRIAMKNPGINILFAHCNWGDITPSLIAHLEKMFPRTYTDKDGNTMQTWEEKGRDHMIILRHPFEKYRHKVFGYTCKIYLRALDPKSRMPNKLRRQGLEIGAALIDQVDLLNADAIDAVLTRLSGKVRKIVMTANPPDDDMPAWYEDTYISENRVNYKGWESRRFLLMNPRDNKHLPTEYVQNLEANLPEDRRIRMVDGVRRTGSGMIYNNLTEDCFIEFDAKLTRDFAVLEIVDWGFRDPSKCQWYIRTPNMKWVWYGSLTRQGISPVQFAKLITDFRRELMYGASGLRRSDSAEFLGTRGDPSIIQILGDGSKSVASQMASYVSPDGMRCNPIPISKARGKMKTSLVNAMITRTKELIDRKVLLINKNGQGFDDFTRQLQQYQWKETKEDAEPNEVRVKGGFDRKTQHHFEEMVCLRYFGWFVNPPTGVDHTYQDDNYAIKERDWSQMKLRPKLERPFQRFERRMRNVS